MLLGGLEANPEIAKPVRAEPIVVWARLAGETSVTTLCDLAEGLLQLLRRLIPVQPKQRPHASPRIQGQLAELAGKPLPCGSRAGRGGGDAVGGLQRSQQNGEEGEEWKFHQGGFDRQWRNGWVGCCILVRPWVSFKRGYPVSGVVLWLWLLCCECVYCTQYISISVWLVVPCPFLVRCWVVALPVPFSPVILERP